MQNILSKFESYNNNNDVILIYIIWTACFVLITMTGSNLINDPDVYWHITTGRWILENGSIPAVDPFSHSMHGAPWHAHEWASAVILAISYQAGGWYGVVTLAVFSAGLALLILAWALSRHLRAFYVAVFIIFGLTMMKGHLFARPHILVLPVMVIWVKLIVEARENNKRPPLLAALLIVLWANMHGSFLIGVLIAGVLAAEAFFAAATKSERKKVFYEWGLFLSIVLFASLLTPHGFRGIIFPFEVLNMKGTLSVIKEWQPPDFSRFNNVGLWLFFMSGAVLFRGLRIPIFRIILILVLLQLTLTHIRSAELLGLIVPILVAHSISTQWSDAPSKRSASAARSTATMNILSGLVAVGALLFLWTRDIAPASKISPEDALKAAQQAGVSGNVLNDYDFGGFLIFNHIPVFIDGRADMYGDAFLKRFVQASFIQALTGGKSESDFLKILSDYNISWSISQPAGVLAKSMDNSAGWKEIYRDDYAIVHIRDERP